MPFAATLKTAALAGLVGLVAATATPAKAERVYARCDGGRCWKVACDSNDCRRTPIRWESDEYVDRRFYDNDRERFYQHHHFDHRTGVWVCDGKSEYCRWSARRW